MRIDAARTRWAPTGPIGDPFAERARKLLRAMGPFSTREIDRSICFGLKIASFRDERPLKRTPWADARSPLPPISLRDHFPEPILDQFDKFQIAPERITKLPAALEIRTGVKRFERLQRVIFYSSLAQLPSILESVVLPSFFRWHPHGRWFFATANRNFHIALAALRVLGSAIDLAGGDIDRLKSFGDLKTMTGAQGGGVFYGSKHLSIPLTLFLPAMHGFVASKVVISFLFLLDTPIPDIREPFPRSGLEFFRTDSSNLFKEDPDIAPEKVTPEDIDTFRLLTPSFDQNDVAQFIDQYFQILDNFLLFMINPANFIRKSDGLWAGLDHYRSWLSFERLTDEVILLATEDTPYLRKLATFRILDQLATLRAARSRDQSKVFRDLILPDRAEDPISLGVSSFGGTVGAYLQTLLRQVRDTLKHTVLSSIFVPGIYDPDSSIVKLPEGTTMSARDYVTGVVRELRNTYHGYHTDQFDKYLLVNSGSTPDSLPALAILAYLALMANPGAFLRREWT